MLLNGEHCCVGARRDGMRNVGGLFCDRAGFRSRLIAGRIELDVDMREWRRSMAIWEILILDSRNKMETENISVPATVHSVRWPAGSTIYAILSTASSQQGTYYIGRHTGKSNYFQTEVLLHVASSPDVSACSRRLDDPCRSAACVPNATAIRTSLRYRVNGGTRYPISMNSVVLW